MIHFVHIITNCVNWSTLFAKEVVLVNKFSVETSGHMDFSNYVVVFQFHMQCCNNRIE